MADVNSTQYGIQSAPPVSAPLDTTDDRGRIRVAAFDFVSVSPGATDKMWHFRFGPGKVKILRYVVSLRTAFGVGATMSIGHNGYTNMSGVAVAAAAAAFLAAFAMDATSQLDNLVNVTITSKSSWDMFGQLAVAAGTNENYSGWIEYVQD